MVESSAKGQPSREALVSASSASPAQVRRRLELCPRSTRPSPCLGRNVASLPSPSDSQRGCACCLAESVHHNVKVHRLFFFFRQPCPHKAHDFAAGVCVRVLCRDHAQPGASHAARTLKLGKRWRAAQCLAVDSRQHGDESGRRGEQNAEKETRARLARRGAHGTSTGTHTKTARQGHSDTHQHTHVRACARRERGRAMASSRSKNRSATRRGEGVRRRAVGCMQACQHVSSNKMQQQHRRSRKHTTPSGRVHTHTHAGEYASYP